VNIDEMIKLLTELKSTRGDLPCVMATSYNHYKVKYIDYSDAIGKDQEHICIRVDDKAKWNMES
jgi:hypothetical protein